MIVDLAAGPDFQACALIGHMQAIGATASAEDTERFSKKLAQTIIGDTPLQFIAVPGDEAARRNSKRSLTLGVSERGMIPAH
mgnify:CR=1 FL=1